MSGLRGASRSLKPVLFPPEKRRSLTMSYGLLRMFSRSFDPWSADCPCWRNDRERMEKEIFVAETCYLFRSLADSHDSCDLRHHTHSRHLSRGTSHASLVYPYGASGFATSVCDLLGVERQRSRTRVHGRSSPLSIRYGYSRDWPRFVPGDQLGR